MTTPPDTPGTRDRLLDDGTSDALIREEPLVIDIRGQTVVTMRTPGADEDLAVGFLLSEGVIEKADDIKHLSFTTGVPTEFQADTITVDAKVTNATLQGRLSRTHEIRSSCGICGMEDIEDMLEGLLPLLGGIPQFDPKITTDLLHHLQTAQTHFAATGGSHGAAIFGPDAQPWAIAEDVGRHNALDKAIGATARNGHDLTHSMALLSGRAGCDLVLKCLRMRIPVILSISAASSLSFDLCKAAGATLVGFLRPERMKIYLSGGRILKVE